MFVERFLRFVPRKNLKKAIGFFNKGDYRKACREFEVYIEHAGDLDAGKDQELIRMYMVESYIEYSRKLDEEGDISSAVKQLEKAIEIQPGYADVHFGLAKLYEKAGRRVNSRESLKRLNRRAAQLVQQVGVDACTDITGFALLGHGQEMAALSGVKIRFYLEKLPFLEGARGYAEDWLFPAGACRNQKHYSPWVHFAPGISEEVQMLLFTPETSGGLLIAVPREKLEQLVALFEAEGQEYWIVGEAVEGEGIEVE